MFTQTPEYMDDLIMSNVRRRGGQMISNPSALMALHGARQLRNTAAVESAGKTLGLREKRLDENQRQFGVNLGLARNEFEYAKDQGNLSNIIAAGGLGLGVLGNYAERQRTQERLAARQKIIDRFRARGDDIGKYWADMISFYE
jgi:hypothetical protein